jgi:hypothetical protein
LPDTLVERLLEIGDPDIALALDSPRQSETARRRIAEHPDVEIRCAESRFVEPSIRVGMRVMPDELAVYAGPDGLIGLVRHEDPVLRATVAGTWEAMPVAVRRELLADPDPRVRKAAAGYPHPAAPADLHAGLRAEVAINPTLPEEARDRLAEDPSAYVRSRVILRQDLPEDRRRRLHAALLAECEEVIGKVKIALTVLDHEQLPWLPARPLAERIAPRRHARRCARTSGRRTR